MTIIPSFEQQRGIDAGGGLVRVESGAGTGKTTMLVRRIVRLIKEGVPPEQILALSFTKAAASEIKSRVSVEAPEAQRVRTSTIHSEANRLLRRFSNKVGFNGARWQIVDGADTMPLFKECADGLVSEISLAGNLHGLSIAALGINLKDKEKMTEFRSYLRDRIDDWKERGVSVDKLEDTMLANPHKVTPADLFAMLLYGRFQDRLQSQKLVEISDLIPLAVRTMEENPDVLRYVAGHNVHVLVDEFQDVNMSQVRFIRLASSLYNNVTIVGDDDQSMYLFRGAIPAAMRNAHRLFPAAAAKGLTDVSLTQNRRTPEQILEVANIMVDINPRDNIKTLHSEKQGKYPSIDSFDNEHVEANVLAGRIKAQIIAGTAPNEICVLSRLTRNLSIINKVFLSQNIPHRMVSGGSFIERTEVRDVLSWIKLVLNPGSEIHFDRAAGSPPRGMGEKAVSLVIKEAQTEGIDCIRALRRIVDHRVLSGKASNGARDMLTILDDIQAGIDDQEPPAAILARTMEQIQYLPWIAGEALEVAAEPAPQIDLFAVPPAAQHRKRDLKQSFDEAMKNKKVAERFTRVRDSFLTLLEMAEGYDNMFEWIDDLTLADEATDRDSKTPAVHVSTIHAAKGLEWDHVHLIGVYQGALPFNQQQSDPELFIGMENPWSSPLDGCLEEERRLAHVALTRAKKTVSISWPQISNMKINRVSEFIELARAHFPALSRTARISDQVDFGDVFRTTGGAMRR